MAASPLSRQSLFALFALLAGLFMTLTAAAADDGAANPDLGKVFAKVWKVQGEVTATGKNGAQRKLREGMPVHVGERIHASATGEAVLKTTDDGMIAVRPNAEFFAERYAAEGKASDRQVLRLITGSLRLITGWIANFNRDDHRVVTPSATIGIRGTDHEPYVLDEALPNTAYKPGTYDKVNRGATALEAAGGNVAIDPGKVGFARKPGDVRTRALFTVLLPVLLDKVPDFYVPGSFDGELDRYADSQEKQAPRAAAAKPAGKPAASEAVAEAPAVALPAGCAPEGIARYWLDRFDKALARRDARAVLALFAPDVVARATVRAADGSTSTIEFKRDEMVNSTLKSIASLKDYRQRRLTVEGRLAQGETEASCRQLDVRSHVIEQGLMNDKPYRFESTEEYVLELRNGEWLATQARTTQR